MNPFPGMNVQQDCLDENVFTRLWMEPPGIYWNPEELSPRDVR